MNLKQREILGIIDKVRQSIEKDVISVDLIPIDDILNLIEADLWAMALRKGAGKTSREEFHNMKQGYEAAVAHFRDSKGAGLVLELLKNQYKCTHALLGDEDKVKRTERHKSYLLAIGSAMASAQCRRNQSPSEAERGYPISFGKEKRGVVYTYLTGLSDSLYQPEYINGDLDYICYTDLEKKWGMKDGVWLYRKLEKEHAQEDAAAMYYRYKIKAYEILKEYDYSIWINPHIQITGELEELYKIYGGNASFLAFPACIHDNLFEAVHTTLSGDDENIELRKRLLCYREEGYPEHGGLISTNIMYRNHRDETLNQAMNIWWQESVGCGQLRETGFSYAAWKCGLNYSLCDLFPEWNAYIRNTELDLELEELQI